MFTGIVEEIGVVGDITKTQTGIRLKIKTHNIYGDAKLGDSIAINGACLSIVDIKGGLLSFDVMQETLSKSTLSRLKINDLVNLERSLKADSRMGGHFVSGHIDYSGTILDVFKGSEGAGFKISLPLEFSQFTAEKGSVAVDGVSLTIAKLARENFTVYLIPHTLKNTTLGTKKKGDPVNIETDLLAKYLSRQTHKPGLQELLKKYNYIS